MRDIKLTLSKDKRLRSPDIEHEADWVNQDGPMFYPLPSCPKDADVGCWVYFIRDGQLVARSKADEFGRFSGNEKLESYTGMPENKGNWHVKCSSMEVLPRSRRLIHTPRFFQGFHYVRPEEEESFRDAFSQSRALRKGRSDNKNLVERDPDKLGGTPVFYGTRVPIQNLFDCLEGDESLDEFLDQFPTVTREQALAVLEESKERLLTGYESAA